MKKNIYLTLIGLFGFATANAQITITTPPLSNITYIDTFAIPTNLQDYNGYATAQTNAKWDFSNAQYPNVQFFSLRSNAASANYPTAKYSNSINYNFAGGLQYNARQYFDIVNNSIVSLGEEIEVEQALSIAPATGDINDELIFPVQNTPYSSPQLERKYPEMMSSSFTSTKSQETKFTITVSGYSLNKTPGSRKSYRTVKDTVIGWGTLKTVGISTKKIYDNIPVLQVRHIETVIDSFFLGGNPAPQPLLDAFGLVQGEAVNFYFVDFIGQGELDEFVRLAYETSPFQNIKTVEIQQNRLEQYATKIDKLALQNVVSTYPNPVVSNTFSVELPTNNSGNWSYTLTDFFGRTVSNGEINTNSGEINLPSTVATGNYILSIKNNDTVVSINKIIKQ